MKTTAILLMFVGPVVLKAECCPGSPVDTTVGTNESNSSTDTPTQGAPGFASAPKATISSTGLAESLAPTAACASGAGPYTRTAHTDQWGSGVGTRLPSSLPSPCCRNA